MVKTQRDRLEHREKAVFCIKVSSLAGDEICRLKNVEQNMTLGILKDLVSRRAGCTVTYNDYFCCGAEIWHDESSKPLQARNDTSHVLEVTWVKNEGIHAGDQLFYTGPSAASSSCIERGDICQIAADLNPHPKYHSVIFSRIREMLRIHEDFLSRRPPDEEVLPFGCQVGDVFFYAGPPRKGVSGTLMYGTRGEVIGAGLIGNSVRLKFDKFPELCSVDFENLSKDPPRSSLGLSLDLLGRCLVRLCLCFSSSSSSSSTRLLQSA